MSHHHWHGGRPPKAVPRSSARAHRDTAPTNNNVGGFSRPSALAVLGISLWFTFSVMQFSVSPSGDWAWGLQWTAPPLTNSSRKSAARRPRSQGPSKRVAAVKAELAQQEHGAQLDASSALLRALKPIPKRVSSGWLPA